jgi:hypothetical protein
MIDRRNFIKTSALTGLAVSLGSSVTYNTPRNLDNKLNDNF